MGNKEFANISKSDKVIVEIIYSMGSDDDIILSRSVVDEGEKPEEKDLIYYNGDFYKVLDSVEKKSEKGTSYIVKCSVKLANLD